MGYNGNNNCACGYMQLSAERLREPQVKAFSLHLSKQSSTRGLQTTKKNLLSQAFNSNFPLTSSGQT